MTNTNILTNKPATASDSFLPFLPARAVDGTVSYASRWVASTLPAWLCIDLEGYYYMQQWKLTFMSAVETNYWSAYYMCDFKLQGSVNGSNWFDLDSLTNNLASQIDRVFTTKMCRYLRVYTTKGLSNNNQVSSIVDFQAAEVTNPPLLTNLVLSTGTLSPTFSSHTLSYSMSVANETGSVAFTPSAASDMQIKVNNTVVSSGSQSAQIPLSVGTNTVTITVTSSTIGTTTYTLTITRAGVSVYLSNLAVIDGGTESALLLIPTFTPTTFDYTVNAASTTSVMVCPTVSNTSATLLVNDQTVVSGDYSDPIALTSASTVITVKVMITGGDTTRYTITVNK
jgi:hypothetical protein